MNSVKKLILELLVSLGIDVGDKKDALEAKLGEIDDAAQKAERERQQRQQSQQQSQSSNGLTEDAIKRAISEAVEEQVRPVRDALAQMTQRAEAAEKAVADQTAAKLKTEREKLVDDAIADGRLTKEQRDQWLADLEKAPDAAQRVLAALPKNPAVNRGKDDKNKNQQQQNQSHQTTEGGTRADTYRQIQADARSLLSPQTAE